MKRYNLYIITLIFGLFFLNACQDENLIKKTGEVEEGIPVDVKLSFESFSLENVQTKADLGTDAENAVKDIYLFVFNRNKELEYQKLHSFSEVATKGSITLGNTITSGKKYIVAIANPGSDDVVLKDYENVNTLDELKKIQLTLKSNLIQRPAANLVMSGYWGENAESAELNLGECLIPPSVSTGNNEVTVSGGKIYFKHLDAKIKFDVQLADSKNKEFIPKDWQVINVPKASYLLTNGEDASVEQANFFSTSNTKFEKMLIENARYRGGEFYFYMMENRKDALNQIADYKERERENKTEEGLNTTYKNADPLSTYVVLRGTYYEYKANGEIAKSADVRYTIHLGYVNNVASDFNTNRNIFYTYHVKIKGVDNIIVEVETSEAGEDFKENQPGAEGDVIISDQNLLLDAHYEVQTIKFFKDNLSNLSVAVKTPYESRTSADLNTGYYHVFEGADGRMAHEGDLKDFEWVQFAKNTDGSTSYQSYKDAKTGNKLKNVKELLKELYDNQNTDGFWSTIDGKKAAVYTVFINEYYYDENPVKGGEASWKEFVNCENRQMHILCDTKFSYDRESSLTKSNIMINQRSIKTIYNTKLSTLETAWGIETVSEDANRIPTTELGSTYKKETKTNGRFNTLQWYKGLSDKSWSTYVDFSKNRSKSTVTAQYACFQRNRDLNGNGKIDPYEIRWYLPATNQFIGLWIGQDALPSETRLLQDEIGNITDGSLDKRPDNTYEHHFISSNNVRFWTEEGVSTGSESSKKNEFNIRCARNLGYKYDNKNEVVPSQSNDKEPQDYVIKTMNASGIVTSIDLSRVDPTALRSGGDKFSSLVFHKEHTSGSLNYPYVKFSVYNGNSGGVSFNANDVAKDPTKGLPKCPDGYRVPNQRELALLVGYSTTSLGGLGSCTYSDLKYKDGKFYTVVWNSGGQFNYLTLSVSSSSASRCVKDID